VVFLGDGDSGKSHTIARLMNNDLPTTGFEGYATNGITTYNMVCDLEGREVTIHLWDFGGQEILHSIHQMFLTERTVYVLMVSAREGTHSDRIRYWLNTLKSFAGSSPVLLVLNKMDMNPTATINEREIRELYPNVKDIAYISALRFSTEEFRIRFTDVLLRMISEQPTLDTRLPASWQKLRRRLGSLEDSHISKAEFEKLCNSCGVSKDSKTRESLLAWFHDLGICFHHGERSGEDDYIVLQPTWVSNALSKLFYGLNSHSQNGLVPCDAIRDCLCGWNESEYTYSLQDAYYILDLMRRYRFSFQWSDELEFIPALCSYSEPPVVWDYRDDPDVFQFRLEFSNLPKHLLHQLMIELKEALDIANVWAFGARFIWNGASSLVVCAENNLNISIQAAGGQREVQNRLTIVRDALDRIRNAFNVEAGRLYVCYKALGEIEWFSYERLTAEIRRGMKEVYSDTFRRMIPITDILRDAEQLQREEQERLISRISAICESIQNNRQYWGAREDALNTHLRDSLIMYGYRVIDQTRTGGARAEGRCDLEIYLDSAPDVPWATGETLYVRDDSESQRTRWKMHFEKLIKQSGKTAAPVVFTITFAACSTEEFPGIREKFAQTFQSVSPNEQRPPMPEVFLLSSASTIYAVRCVYDGDGDPVTAYHFLVRIGFDQVLEEKLEQQRQMPNSEYKVVFLGDGEAGKSLTVARLYEPTMDVKSFNGEVTPGVSIRSRTYEVKGIEVQVNFWDFGGQEILHSMHRIFLSKRTLYVVVLNARNDSQDERARFWLRYINTYAPGAPVILVLNKIDQNKYASLNEPVLRRLYPNIRQFLKISALKWTQEEFQNHFIAHLEKHISSIEVEESTFVEKERNVRDVLRAWKKPRISLQEYKTECVEHGIEEEEDQAILLKKLENSGICVHFDGHSAVGEYRLLEPKWITNAIYIILFNLHSQAKNGIISHSKIQELFSKDPKELQSVENTRYEPSEVDFILEVMRSYRLSFKIQGPEEPKEFLPMLCPRDEAAELEMFLKEKEQLEFHMCFDYLPSEALYQLMVARQHELELEKDSIWLTGALLRNQDGCRAAVVKEDNVLRFHISRSQNLKHARSYMDSLRHDMEQIIWKNKLKEPEIRVIYKHTYKTMEKKEEKHVEEPFDFDRLIQSQECGVLDTFSKELKKAVAINDILNQTYHGEKVLHDTLFHQLVDACRILQENINNWGQDERVLNCYLRDLLRAKGYDVKDQPESGASSTWKDAGRPDLIVPFANSASSVLIEALRITGHAKTDIKKWDEHLERMVNNYNSSGYRMMVLVSYAICTKSHFRRIDKIYHERMRKAPTKGGIGRPEHCIRIETEKIPALIRITKSEYYTESYSPTIYHFLVHIPKAE
jgi:small GTP-binding protein